MCVQTRFIKKKSSYSVQETIDKLEVLLKEKEIAIFTKINHYQNAKDIGLEMNESQVILFGNPKIGTLMMQNNIDVSTGSRINVDQVLMDEENYGNRIAIIGEPGTGKTTLLNHLAYQYWRFVLSND